VSRPNGLAGTWTGEQLNGHRYFRRTPPEFYYFEAINVQAIPADSHMRNSPNVRINTLYVVAKATTHQYFLLGTQTLQTRGFFNYLVWINPV
jgi:hypothetical protein